MNDEQERVFYELVWPQRSAVLRVALILTGNAADAEDLSQDVLLKAYRAIGSFQAGTNMKAWLMTILRNTRIDRLRTVGSKVPDVSLDALDMDPAAPQEATGTIWENPQELLVAFSDQQVIDALKALPEEIRWTLLLVDVEGWDQAEAANLLQVPVGTIKSRTHRGRAMLREVLVPVARQMRLVRE